MAYSRPYQEMETKMVWPRLQVFWLIKDGSVGHSKIKQEEADRRKDDKWTGMDLASSVRQLRTGSNVIAGRHCRYDVLMCLFRFEQSQSCTNIVRYNLFCLFS